MSSKIKVDTIENVAGSGNVSLGSGHNLVVPGNNTTSGNATVGGTLGVTGATTTAGITSSAAHTVTTSTHANASVFKSTGNTQIMLQDTDASANDQFWGLQNSGGEFNILTCNDDRASGFVTPMTITQAGYVKKPNQVSFIATGSNGAYVQTSPVPFPTVVQNVGNGYNNSNYTFTAPIAGTYFFHFHCGIVNGSANQQIYPYFQKNGSNFMYSYTSIATTYYAQSHMTALVPLAANDTMRVTMATPSSSATYYNSSQETRFNGYLLG